jgi:hypothetical protein
MVIVLLVLAVSIGLMLLASAACEHELLRNERDEKPQPKKAA